MIFFVRIVFYVLFSFPNSLQCVKLTITDWLMQVISQEQNVYPNVSLIKTGL